MSQKDAPVGHPPVAVWLTCGTSVTTDCAPGIGLAPVVMWNARLCQMMLLANNGFENFVQFRTPLGQTTRGLVNAAAKSTVCFAVANPDGWFVDVMIAVLVQLL